MNARIFRVVLLVWPVLACAFCLYDKQEWLATLWGGVALGVLMSRFTEWRLAREAVFTKLKARQAESRESSAQ